MNLFCLLDNPDDHIFLTDLRSNTSYSYNDLYAASVNLSRFLDEKSVLSGKKIVYFTVNSPFFFPLLFACSARNAALVPLNPQMRQNEINNIVKRVSPKIIFYDESFKHLDNAFKGYESIPVKNNDLFGSINSLDKKALLNSKIIDKHSDGKTALIIYTSGTTTNIKGVALTHKNLYAMANNFSEFYEFRESQRFLSMLPFHHINAPMITGLACIIAKAHVFLGDVYGFGVARSLWDTIQQNKIQTLSITPSIMASLIEMYAKGIDRKPPSIEYALVGAAHLKEDLWKKFEGFFHIPCFQGYGLTETTTWATMTPKDDRKRYDSAGIPVGCEVRIEQGRGEVLIKGDIIMKGYWGNLEATKTVLNDGWLKTGDLGIIDTDGQLIITGRIKNIIKRRGQLIIAEDIDSAIGQHPSVMESCTLGIADHMMGEKVVTTCVLKERSGEIENELYDFARQNLSMQNFPDEFVFLKQLPKNSLGKPNIKILKEYFTGQTAQEVFEILDKIRFRKAKTPDKENIIQIIQTSLIEDAPFYLTGYWGVGHRDHANDQDRIVLDNLGTLINDINQYVSKPIAKIKFILTDIHGKANFIPELSAGKYFKSIEEELQKRGFEYVYLSEIWRRKGLIFENILEQIHQEDFKRSWGEFSLRDQFIKQAARRGHGDAKKGAQRYYAIAIAEREAVAQYCGEKTIFFTHNDPRHRIVHPPLSAIYIYSIKPGFSDKPWFLESTKMIHYP